QASASLAGLVLAMMLAGGWAVASAGQAGMVFLDQPDRLAGMPGGTTTLTLRMTAPFAVLLLLPAGAVLLWLLASRSLVFAPSKLAFKGSRLSILSNAKQKFGRSGLVEFLKRLAKMLAVAGLLAWFLRRSLPEVMMSSAMEPGPLAALMAREVQ